jgi:hypothetical protein
MVCPDKIGMPGKISARIMIALFLTKTGGLLLIDPNGSLRKCLQSLCLFPIVPGAVNP